MKKTGGASSTTTTLYECARSIGSRYFGYPCGSFFFILRRDRDPPLSYSIWCISKKLLNSDPTGRLPVIADDDVRLHPMGPASTHSNRPMDCQAVPVVSNTPAEAVTPMKNIIVLCLYPCCLERENRVTRWAILRFQRLPVTPCLVMSRSHPKNIVIYD